MHSTLQTGGAYLNALNNIDIIRFFSFLVKPYPIAETKELLTESGSRMNQVTLRLQSRIIINDSTVLSEFG